LLLETLNPLTIGVFHAGIYRSGNSGDGYPEILDTTDKKVIGNAVGLSPGIALTLQGIFSPLPTSIA